MATNNQSENYEIRRGVYDSDYFSGAQVALYIGDVWIDEITTVQFQLIEPRVPLHGYADVLFKDVCRGQVMVQGAFNINFKEAGYLWLVLNRYKKSVKNQVPPLDMVHSYTNQQKEIAKSFNIEETYVQNAVGQISKKGMNDNLKALAEQRALALSQRALTGYASSARGLAGATEMLGAESAFEAFENVIWGTSVDKAGGFDSFNTRRVTDKQLNPFDIYITYGDYTGDDRLHHTVQKLDTVYLTGVGKQIIIDGSPIQEQYTFIARDLV